MKRSSRRNSWRRIHPRYRQAGAAGRDLWITFDLYQLLALKAAAALGAAEGRAFRDLAGPLGIILEVCGRLAVSHRGA